MSIFYKYLAFLVISAFLMGLAVEEVGAKKEKHQKEAML
jgi:hypothetical protein